MMIPKTLLLTALVYLIYLWIATHPYYRYWLIVVLYGLKAVAKGQFRQAWHWTRFWWWWARLSREEQGRVLILLEGDMTWARFT
jgi:hypothetical protein